MSFDPPDAVAASSNTDFTLIVYGTGFVSTCAPDCHSPQLYWNGKPLDANTGYTDVSFSVTVPAESTPKIVPVYAYNGLSSLSTSYNVRPSLQGLSLNSVSAGSLAQTVSLYGYLTYSPNETFLWNNNSTLSATYSPGSNTITVSVPASLLSTSGTASIVVMDVLYNPTNGLLTPLKSDPQYFDVRAPAITSISPNTVNAGLQPVTVDVFGTDFITNSMNTSQVYLGNTQMTTQFVSTTHLQFVVVPSLPGSLDVTVHNTPNAVSAKKTLLVAMPTPPSGQFFVNGNNPTPAPKAQYDVKFKLLSGYALPLNVTVTPTFGWDPNTAGMENDLARRAIVTCMPPCQIAAGATDSPVDVVVQAGTTAGTVQLAAALKLLDGTDVTPSPPPSWQVSIPPSMPVIDPSPESGVQMEINGSSFNICVQGYSTTREMVDVSFHFDAAPGKRIAPSDITPSPSGTLGNCPYSSESVLFQCHFDATGAGHFNYVQTFSVNGNVSDIAGASVTMRNKQNNQGPPSGPFQAVVGACNQMP